MHSHRTVFLDHAVVMHRPGDIGIGECLRNGAMIGVNSAFGDQQDRERIEKSLDLRLITFEIAVPVVIGAVEGGPEVVVAMSPPL